MRKDNLIKIDRDIDKLIDLSFKRREEGDYVGAMSILKNILLTEKDADIYAHIADIYTDMGKYENAVNCWYKYLSLSKKKYYIDGYNGLGANFFLIGNDSVAGYYFKKQMEQGPPDDLVYADVFEDYFDSLIESKNDAFKVVYPPNAEEEYKEIVENADVMMLNGEYGDAIDQLEKIPKSSESYKKAKVSEAYAYYYLKMPDEAYAEAKAAIEAGEINVYSLTVAIDVCAASAKASEVGRYLDIALKYSPESEEEKYKKLHLLVSLNLNAEALSYSETILGCAEFLSNIRYLRGILYYNLKDYAKAEEEFRYSFVLSSGYVAKYCREISEKAISGDVIYKRLEPYFELPEKEVTRRVALIKSLYDDKSAVDFPSDFEDILGWVFNGENRTLQVALAILVFSRGAEKHYGTIRDALIDGGVSDDVKQRVVSIMCEYGVTGAVDLVLGYIYRRITIPGTNFEGENSDIVRRAFAFALGKATVFEDKYHKLVAAAQDTAAILSDVKTDISSGDVPALACAIYMISGIRQFDNDEVLYEYFSTTEKKVSEILKKIR